MSLWFKHLEIGWSILGEQNVPKKSGKRAINRWFCKISFLPAEAEILADDDCLEPTMFGLATCKWCTDRTNSPCRYQFNFHDCRRKRKTDKLIKQHWAFAKLECFEDGILQASVFGIYLKIFSWSPGQVSFFFWRSPSVSVDFWKKATIWDHKSLFRNYPLATRNHIIGTTNFHVETNEVVKPWLL